MRIQFNSTAHCGHLAKSLKRELSGHRVDLSLSVCQNAVARMMGYRNWQELRALSLMSNVESASDQELLPIEAAARRAHQANALASEISIPLDQAMAIVDKIRPTGRRLSAVPNWRDRFMRHSADVAEQGFGAEGIAHLNKLLAKKGRGRGAWQTLDVEGLGEVRIQVKEIKDVYKEFEINSIVAILMTEGVPAAVLDGYVVTASMDTFAKSQWGEEDEYKEIEHELFMCADCIEDDLVEVVHSIIDQGKVIDIFHRGSLLVLNDLRRNLHTTSKDAGMRLVAAAIEHVNERHARYAKISTMAFEPLVDGYDDMDYNARRESAEFRAASAHVASAFENSTILRNALGRKPLVLTCDTGPAPQHTSLTSEQVGDIWNKVRHAGL